MDELRFDGRVAIVTGAGRERGLGEAHAKFLAARGASVVVNDLAAEGETPAQRVVDDIRAAGGIAIANADSVASEEGAAAIVAAAIDSYGRLDIIVNNAGLGTGGSFPDWETIDRFTRHFEVHLAGAFNVSRAAWPHFVRDGGGRIINITSSALFGLTADMSHMHESRSGNIGVGYSSMKSGMIGLTKCLANYGAQDNIKVNVVAPAAATKMGPNNSTVLSSGELLPLDPSLVSAGIAVLAHDLCPATGEIFGMGGGRVDRVFVAATQGYVDASITPERLLANWGQVMDVQDSWIPTSSRAHADRLRQDRGALLGA